MSNTYQRLVEILARDHALPPERLTPDATLEALGIDSLATVELLWSIEETFRIKVPADPIELHTLGDVVRYVDLLSGGQGGPTACAVAEAPAARAT